MRLVQLSRHNIAFPSPEGALREPNGLLALGGDLSPARLLMAYQRGIFPWFSPGDPILWWSPDPRAVLWPAQFHLSRSMKRFHAKSPYRVTLNHAFGQVIEGCAEDRHEGTWITRDIVNAYHQLHELGYAHSIEVWEKGGTGWRHVRCGARDAVLRRIDVLPCGQRLENRAAGLLRGLCPARRTPDRLSGAQRAHGLSRCS